MHSVKTYGPNKVKINMCIVTLAQGHNTSLGLDQQFCEILLQSIHSVKTCGLDKVKTTVQCDLDIRPVTLAQGHDTSMGVDQFLCEILFQSMHSMKTYGPDKVKTTMCIATLNFDQ